MSNLNQLILSFDHEQNFKNLDFYVSKSNADVFNLINSWQTTNEKFLNISGEKFCGKTHLINIFLEKNMKLTNIIFKLLCISISKSFFIIYEINVSKLILASNQVYL